VNGELLVYQSFIPGINTPFSHLSHCGFWGTSSSSSGDLHLLPWDFGSYSFVTNSSYSLLALLKQHTLVHLLWTAMDSVWSGFILTMCSFHKEKTHVLWISHCSICLPWAQSVCTLLPVCNHYAVNTGKKCKIQQLYISPRCCKSNVHLANLQYFYTGWNTTLMYQHNDCNLNCKLKGCNFVVFLNPVIVQSL